MSSSVSTSDDIGNGLMAFAWVLFAVSLVVVSARVWTRVGYLKDRMQIHDWLMVCAIVRTFAVNIHISRI